MDFYFCEKCGKRLTEHDIEQGAGKNKKLKGVYCSVCSVGVLTLETLPITEEQARKILAASPAVTAPRPLRQEEGHAVPGLRAEDERSKIKGARKHPNRRLGIAAALAGTSALLTVTILFLVKGTSRPVRETKAVAVAPSHSKTSVTPPKHSAQPPAVESSSADSA